MVDSEQIIEHIKRFNYNSDTLHKLLVAQSPRKQIPMINCLTKRGGSKAKALSNSKAQKSGSGVFDGYGARKEYVFKRDSSQELITLQKMQMA